MRCFRNVFAEAHMRRCIFAGVCVALTGCWSSTPYPLVRIEGSIKYEDGSLIPAEGMQLRFLPQADAVDPRVAPRKATVFVDVATGSFTTMTTYRHDDGVISGRHRVLVQATASDGSSVGLVPHAYANAKLTPLVADTADRPMQLLVRKPQ